ncbi:MAG TPA: hypothetical protein VN855_00500, partial [Candidatus Acidoferrum sp.]|nr:hypothetical protein [Candidatus Acidoferrum sp.]
ALTVQGRLLINGAFHFTPSSLVAPQGNVSIGGDFSFEAASDFRVNKGQSPMLTVNGNMLGNSFAFDGSGQVEANGLTINVGDDVDAISFNLNGGNSAGVADAGFGGQLSANGSINNIIYTANGGDSAFSGFAAGAGGGISSASFSQGFFGYNSNITINGGNATVVGSTVGGDGGGFTVNGPITLSPSGTIQLNGGNGYSGNGGKGGQLGFSTTVFYGSVSLNGGNSILASGGNGGFVGSNNPISAASFKFTALTANGGNGAINGGDSSFNVGIVSYLGDECTFASISMNGGNGTSGVGGAGGPLVIDGTCTIIGAATFNGGNGGTTAGSSGSFNITGFLSAPTTNLTMNGGNGTVAGSAGTLTAQSGFTIQAIAAHDGTGTTPGSSGKIFLAGNCVTATIDLTNRSTNKIQAIGNVPSILKVSSLPGKNVLTNFAGLDLFDISMDVPTSLLTYDPTSDKWTRTFLAGGKRRATATNDTATYADFIVEVTNNVSQRTMTLPDATTCYDGQELIYKDKAGTAGSANNILFATQSGQTIDGASPAGVSISVNSGVLRLYTDKLNWYSW